MKTHRQAALIYSYKELVQIQVEFGEQPTKKLVGFELFVGLIIESNLHKEECQISVGFSIMAW